LKNQYRGLIPNSVDISERPTEVDFKARFGDLEGDNGAFVGKDHKGAVVTLNDRKRGLLVHAA
jgi:IS30 family transposase